MTSQGYLEPAVPCKGHGIKFKILVLHALRGDFRKTTFDHVYCYPAYRPGNLYAFHHLLAPVTPELISFPFDAVIINYCFLAQRDTRLYPEFRKKYAFLSTSKALKIAINQDECTLSEVLDDWLDFMKIDLIYTPVTRDLEVLYPQCSSRVRIKHAFAGYSHPKDLARLDQFFRPFRERTIDLGTRVRYLPPYFGSHGVLKGRAAERLRDAARSAGFTVDISTRPEDVFAGDEWFAFLGSCRFTFATRAGASVHDPDGSIRQRVNEFLAAEPEAPFEKVAAACFPGLDRYDFSCVSPRLFEAAVARTGLIMLEDFYVDGLEPYRHYIPLKRDFSNLDEVFALMRDDAAAERMTEAAHRHLVQSERFSYGSLVDDVMAEIEMQRPAPRRASTEQFANLAGHYDRLDPSQHLVVEASPHWSRIGRFAADRAQREGRLSHLTELLAARLRNAGLHSIPAAELACAGTLNSTLAGLTAEAANGLAGHGRDLAAFASMLAEAAKQPGDLYLDRDWGYCEYVYDPAPETDRAAS